MFIDSYVAVRWGQKKLPPTPKIFAKTENSRRKSKQNLKITEIFKFLIILSKFSF